MKESSSWAVSYIRCKIPRRAGLWPLLLGTAGGDAQSPLWLSLPPLPPGGEGGAQARVEAKVFLETSAAVLHGALAAQRGGGRDPCFLWRTWFRVIVPRGGMCRARRRVGLCSSWVPGAFCSRILMAAIEVNVDVLVL